MKFIEFDRKTLKDRLKILFLYNDIVSIWINNDSCEGVITCDTSHRHNIPYNLKNITSISSFNLNYNMYKTSIENSIAEIITIKIDNEKNIIISEKNNTNKLNYTSELENIKKSISAYEEYKILDSFEAPKDIENNNVKNSLNCIKFPDGYTSLYESNDFYQNDSEHASIYKINVSDYVDDPIIFVLTNKQITSFSKKLIKSSYIQLSFTEETVIFSSLRNDTIDRSILKVSLLKNITSLNEKKYKLEIKHFIILKKLTVSEKDIKNTKDKKIFSNISFHVIRNNNKFTGLVYLPCAIPQESLHKGLDFLSFMPLVEL